MNPEVTVEPTLRRFVLGVFVAAVFLTAATIVVEQHISDNPHPSLPIADLSDAPGARIAVVDQRKLVLVIGDRQETVAFDSRDSEFRKACKVPEGVELLRPSNLKWSPNGKFLVVNVTDAETLSVGCSVVVDVERSRLTFLPDKPSVFNFITNTHISTPGSRWDPPEAWDFETQTLVPIVEELEPGLRPQQTSSSDEDEVAVFQGTFSAIEILSIDGRSLDIFRGDFWSSKFRSSEQVLYYTRGLSPVGPNSDPNASQLIAFDIETQTEQNISPSITATIDGAEIEDLSHVAGDLGPLGELYVDIIEDPESTEKLAAVLMLVDTRWNVVSEGSSVVANTGDGGRLSVEMVSKPGAFPTRFALRSRSEEGQEHIFDQPGGGQFGLTADQADVWLPPGAEIGTEGAVSADLSTGRIEIETN